MSCQVVTSWNTLASLCLLKVPPYFWKLLCKKLFLSNFLLNLQFIWPWKLWNKCFSNTFNLKRRQQYRKRCLSSPNWCIKNKFVYILFAPKLWKHGYCLYKTWSFKYLFLSSEIYVETFSLSSRQCSRFIHMWPSQQCYQNHNSHFSGEIVTHLGSVAWLRWQRGSD